MKKILCSLLVLLGLTAVAGTPSVSATVTLDRVQQRYPWNGYVDFDFTVEGVDYPQDYYVEFRATVTNQGVEAFYLAETLLDDGHAYEASNGTWRVTWDTWADGAKFYNRDVHFSARLVYSPKGSVGDRERCPYTSTYAIINLADMSTPTNVVYETWHGAEDDTNRYNTSEYKTTKLVLRRINRGTFLMGTPASVAMDQYEVEKDSGVWKDILKETEHLVTLTKDYYFGVFPVTRHQYALIMGNSDTYDEQPVTAIWCQNVRGGTDGLDITKVPDRIVDADSFMGKLRAHTGGELKFDLPTEAQWERACRAGTTSLGYYGNPGTDPEYGYYLTNVDVRAYVLESSQDGADTGTVGTKLPNRWGLFDTLGCISELCLDKVGGWHENLLGYDLGSAPVTDPLILAEEVEGDAGAVDWVYRSYGRAKGQTGDNVTRARAGARFRWVEDGEGYQRGFRVAAQLEN